MKHIEDNLHKLINTYLKYYQKTHDDLIFYTYMPFGEKRDLKTGVLLKAKGTKRGVPDFMLLFKNHIVYWIECKTDKGTLTKEQEAFQKMIKDNYKSWQYYVVRSLDDLECALGVREW